MGKPGTFSEGPDSRRNTKGRPPGAKSSLRTLAKRDAEDTWGRLGELSKQETDLKVSLEATKLRALYAQAPPKDTAEPEEEKPEEKPETDLREVAKLLTMPGPGRKTEGTT